MDNDTNGKVLHVARAESIRSVGQTTKTVQFVVVLGSAALTMDVIPTFE